MKTISESLGDAVGGIRYEAKDGRTHEVRPLTLERMGLYERHLESKALEAIKNRRAILGDSYGEALSVTTQDIVSGKYVFTGPVCMKAIETFDGQTALLAILMGVDNIRARRLMLEDPEGLRAALDAMLKQSQATEGSEGNRAGEAATS